MPIPQRVIDNWRYQGRSEDWIKERIIAFAEDIQYRLLRRQTLKPEDFDVGDCEDCRISPKSRSMCDKHYKQWYRQTIENPRLRSLTPLLK